jgi:hypothetical protein
MFCFVVGILTLFLTIDVCVAKWINWANPTKWDKVAERTPGSSIFAAGQATTYGRDSWGDSRKFDPWTEKRDDWNSALPRGFTTDVYSKSKCEPNPSRVPKDIDDFKERLRAVHPVDRVISFLDLGVDMSKAFWADLDLATKLKNRRFLDEEEHLRSSATLVLGQGLATFYGSEYFRRAAPWARNLITHGTYAHPIRYLEEMGFEVQVAKTDSLINKGNIKRNIASIGSNIEKAKRRNQPVYSLDHSVDALSAQVYMAENQDVAREVDGFFLGAGPLPEEVNPWIGDLFVALTDGEANFHYVGEVLDFYASGGSDKVNIISMKDSPDRVLDGWAGGQVISVDGGHSSIFHQIKNLRGIVHFVNDTSFPQLCPAA